MWDEATMAHEIGHTLTPNEVAWAQVAAENYNNDWDTAVNALSQYGVGSEQYYVASLPLANDWNAAVQAGTNKELVASVVGAQIFGNAYEKSGVGTFADGVQAFVNTYIGNEAGDVPPTYNPPTNNPSSVNPSNSDTGFDYHGTPLQQIISIANANPSITVTIPENIIADAQKTGEIGPNDYVPGATYFISPTDGKLYYTVPWGAPPMPDIAPPPPPTDDVSAPAPASPSPAPATDVQPAADAAAQQDVAANDGTTATVASVVDNNSGDINSGDLSDSFTSDDSGDQDIYMGGPTCDSENSCQ
jgi:hypothetical protein